LCIISFLNIQYFFFMEELARQVWEAWVVSPKFTLSVLTTVTGLYATSVWWYYKKDATSALPMPLPHVTDSCSDNTVYLTVFRSHRPCFLYLASFLYGIKKYFTQFVNCICLLICGLQIHEYNDLRSVPALLCFALAHALVTVWEQHSKLKVQSDINHQRVWKRAKSAKDEETNLLVLQKTLRRGDFVPLSIDRNTIVPADLYVVEGSLFVNEKELTGEDVAVPKTIGSNVYRGTSIIKGCGFGKVVAVGNDCQMYQRSHDIQKPPTKVQKHITFVCMVNLYLLLLISTLTAIVLYQQNPPNVDPLRRFTVFWRHFKKMLLLLNTVIPLGLQLSFNAASTLLSHQISRVCQVNIRAQGLCSFQNEITHVCSDKTGTLTLNELVVAHVSQSPRQVVENVLAVTDVTLNEKGELVRFDDMEHTLLRHFLPQTKDVFEENVPLSGGSLRYNKKQYQRLVYAPFDHKWEIKHSILRGENSVTLHAQGTPEAILRLAKDPVQSAELWQKFLTECPTNTNSYNRIIAYGRKVIGTEWNEWTKWQTAAKRDKWNAFQGLEDLAFYCFHDRLIPDVAQSIAALRQQSIIGFSILTGDKLETCVEIARQLGLLQQQDSIIPTVETASDSAFCNTKEAQCVFINGRNLEELLFSFDFSQLLANSRVCKVVYRCAPFAKQLYVRHVQQQGCVMMVGDGINDISACLEAQTSVSVANGSPQLVQVTDITIPEWSAVPALLRNFRRQQLRIQNITGWILMKHLMTAGHLLAMLCLSNLRLLQDPSNPLIMNLFNTSMFAILCVHCYLHEEQTISYSCFHLMWKGGVLGMLTASSAFEYFELERVNDVMFMMLPFQVLQLICQMLKFEKSKSRLAWGLYYLVAIMWLMPTIHWHGSTKLQSPNKYK
jgi:magnesium-transporting ATPase (P-type)